MQKKYTGVVVPMVTPLTDDRKIDSKAVATLVNHLIGSGGHPFIIGTTGEAASISREEKLRLAQHTVEATNGRATVYAGVSGNCLQESIDDAIAYNDLGIEAVVATAPCYYPLDNDQMLKYFETLANNIPCPLIIYNIPATTHLSIPIDVVDKLSRHENIAGFKDSEKGVERIDAAVALWKDRSDFSYLLGWALQSSYAISLGADGIVPSTGNIAPAVYRAIVDSARKGDKAQAIKAQEKADKISLVYQQGRSLSHSLAGLKAMLSGYGLCGPEMLPPLYRMDANEEKNIIKTTFNMFGDLKEINSVN